MWPCPPLYYWALLCAVVTANVQAPVIAAVSHVPYIQSGPMHLYTYVHAVKCGHVRVPSTHIYTVRCRHMYGARQSARICGICEMCGICHRCSILLMSNTTRSDVWYQSFTRATRHIHTAWHTDSCVSQYSFLCVTLPILVCHVTHCLAWHYNICHHTIQ